MRHLIAWIALFLLLGPAAAPAEPPPVLQISTNNTPMDRKALQALSDEAFRRLGLGVQFLSLPSERSLQQANDGEVDGEGLRIAGLGNAYPNLIQVPERYIGISFVAFARDPALRLDQGWDSLKPYSVAHIHGWKLFEAQAGVARAVYKVDKPEQLFQMLDSGRVDLILYTRNDGVALAKKLGIHANVVSPALKDVDMYLYLHRRHEALVPRLAQTLRAMKADGSHPRILSNLSPD
ncbi:MAG: hypothetical protein RIR00_1538 [Pseudomonadota bacterium]|jgi:polar amino acid transport system substrate-binding protein